MNRDEIIFGKVKELLNEISREQEKQFAMLDQLENVINSISSELSSLQNTLDGVQSTIDLSLIHISEPTRPY